jgi:pimeloyl-ACP methyl ester carboxylesterase
MTEYMISMRKLDGSAGLGPTQYLAFDDAVTPPMVMKPDDWVTAVMAGFPPAAPGQRRTGDILFFVHGFNVSHQSTVTSHLNNVAALAQAGWTGRVISYDWPSDGLTFAYVPDRFNARAAASGLVSSGIALLEKTQRDNCTINVHVMGHSMGCFVIQQAFTWAYQDVPSSWSIAQLILVAADVDNTVFSADNYSAKMFVQHAGRLTAYCNRYDKALTVSDVKRLDTSPRMGRVGLPADAPSAMCEVDCSDFFDQTYPGFGPQMDPQLTHCFYFSRPEFWKDAVLTLAGGLDRTKIPTRAPDPASDLSNRFVLDPNISDQDYRTALARAGGTPSTP